MNRSSDESSASASSVAASSLGSEVGAGSGIAAANCTPSSVCSSRLTCPLLAIAIDELLRHDGAQPALERTATGVGQELRLAKILARVDAIEIGEEGVGQVSGVGGVARDVQCHAVQLLPITADEIVPGLLVAGGTGPANASSSRRNAAQKLAVCSVEAWGEGCAEIWTWS